MVTMVTKQIPTRGHHEKENNVGLTQSMLGTRGPSQEAKRCQTSASAVFWSCCKSGSKFGSALRLRAAMSFECDVFKLNRSNSPRERASVNSDSPQLRTNDLWHTTSGKPYRVDRLGSRSCRGNDK
jgi:hypothetical protein